MTHIYPQLGLRSPKPSNPSSEQPTGRLQPSRNLTRTSALAILGSGLIGGLAISSQVAWARPVLNDTNHFLVAQQVVDGLPPPPPVIFGQESLPNGQSQIAQNQTGQHYLVVVNGDSQMLLSQVQQVQPSASMQDYNGQRFIQAGLFNDPTSAQQQVSTLSASGINAQVVPVTSAGSSAISQTPVTADGQPASSTMYGGTSVPNNTLPPPEVLPTTSVPASPGGVEFGSSPNALPAPSSPGAEGPRGSRSYYVIIPSGGRDATTISNQIARLTDGMGVDGMVQTGSARGTHIRVGPFNDRGAANRWTRYFRDFGMDARVSYSR